MFYYKNLTEEQLNFVRSYYYIPDGDKQIYLDDLNFVLEYRNLLIEALIPIWNSTSQNTEECMALAHKKFAELGVFIANHMRNSKPENIMRSMYFIKKIPQDLQLAEQTMVNSGNYNPFEITRACRYTSDVSDYLCFVCANALRENDAYKAKQQELAENTAQRLLNRLQKRFLNHVNREDYQFDDLIFIAGQIYIVADNKKEEIEKVKQRNCNDCHKDDCMTSGCKEHEEIVRYEEQVKGLEKLSKLLLDFYKTRTVNTEEVRRLANELPIGDLRGDVEALLKIDLTNPYNFRPKPIAVNFGKERNICVQPAKIKQSLEQRKIDKNFSSKAENVAAQIVLNYYDFSPSTGEMVEEWFENWYQKFLQSDNYKNSQSAFGSNRFTELLKAYKKLESNNNDEESKR